MHEWKISYRSTKAEGYVITELQRLIEAKRKCPNMKVLYYYTDEGVIREINTGSR